MPQKAYNRRDFILYSAAAVSTMVDASLCWPSTKDQGYPTGAADIRGTIFKGDAPKKIWKWSHEGFAYRKLANKKVVCRICPNRCILAPGDRSVCRSKVNLDGTLYSLVYGNPCAVNLDPIEKKPLFHFKPNSKAFSIATTGCNFRCLNCQNWEISQATPEAVRYIELFPPQVVAEAQRSEAPSIAYTYTEAITYFEYMIDTARIARENNINNLLISNGYINKGPLLALCEVLDAANINLKSFQDETYRKLNGGRLAPVLNTLKTLHAQGVHFEITTLVVPGYVDDEDMIKEMCDWILDNLGPNYPLHFLRFFPKFKLNRLPPTPVSMLTRFRNIARQQGMRYVYVGNVPDHEGNNTYCHHCRRLLIERKGYFITANNLIENRCKFCGTTIPGVWS